MSRALMLSALLSLVFIVGCTPRQYRYDVAMPVKNEVKTADVGMKFLGMN